MAQDNSSFHMWFPSDNRKKTEVLEHLVTNEFHLSERHQRNLHIYRLSEPIDYFLLHKVLQKYSQLTTQLEMDSCLLAAQAFVKILRLMPKLQVITMNNCSLLKQNILPQSTVLILPDLRQLRILDSHGVSPRRLFLGGKVTAIEVEIDDRWSKTNISNLNRFINEQQGSLKTLKIVNDHCNENLSLKPSAQCQLEFLCLEHVDITKNTLEFIKLQKRLRRADLSFTCLNSLCYIAIGSILTNNEQLEEFSLNVDTAIDNQPQLLDRHLNVNSLTFHEKLASNLLRQLTACMTNIFNLKLTGTNDCQDDSDKCKWISTLQNLVSLELINIQCFALRFVKCKSLRKVILNIKDHVSNSDERILFYKNNRGITLLELNFLSKDECTDLVSSLPQLEVLRVLQVDHLVPCVEILSTAKRLKALTMPEAVLQKIPAPKRKLFEDTGKRFQVLEFDFPYAYPH